MSGLILKLRPHEEVMINGVTVQNGDKKTLLRIKTSDANILRLRNAMKPEEATTPLHKAYYAAQSVVAGDVLPADAASFIRAILADGEHKNAALRPAALEPLIEKGDYYAVMRIIGDMIKNGENEPASLAAE